MSGPEPQRVASRSSDWRWPALAVVALLLLVVGIGRLGDDLVRRDQLGPTPTGSLAAPDAHAPAQPTESFEPSLPSAVRTGLSRYSDGIPSSLNTPGGGAVMRLPQALHLKPGTELLIGGWYRMADCDLSGYGWSCPYDQLADNPAGMVSPPTEGVRLVNAPLRGTGAVVVRGALAERDCTGDWRFDSSSLAFCPLDLVISDVIWQGDPLTQTAPISVVDLLGGLKAAFADFQPEASLAPRCGAQWPAQTWHSGPSPVRVIAVLPSAADAAREAGALTAAGALAGALALGSPARDEPQPVTIWQALRRLAGLRGGLANLIVPGQMVCGAGLPESTYAIDLLANRAYFPEGGAAFVAIFNSTAEREQFEASVAADDAWVGDCHQPAPESGVRGGMRGTSRWLSYANVLINLNGPSYLDLLLHNILSAPDHVQDEGG